MASLSVVSVTRSQPAVWKYWMENSKSKQFVGFELCAVLSSMMKTRTLQLRPIQDVDHPFVQVLWAVDAPRPLVTQ